MQSVISVVVAVVHGTICIVFADAHDSSNMYFAFRWLLIVFKREFSFTDIMRLWEVFWTDKPCKNYQVVIAVAMLHKETEFIISNEFGFNEILKVSNSHTWLI